MTACVQIQASPNFKIEGRACFLVELHEANVIQMPLRIEIREARLDFYLMRIDSEIQSACMRFHVNSQAAKAGYRGTLTLCPLKYYDPQYIKDSPV